MSSSKNRNQNAIRYRKFRSNSSIKAVQNSIEQNFGLPEGSVRLINPNGKKIRSDATLKTLSANWEAYS